MNYSIISKNRNLLMGIATVMIVTFHTNFLNIGNFNYIVQKMDVGVDVFLCLSGFGLFYSWKKCKDIKVFLFKRFSRIYLPLIITVTLFTLIGFMCEYWVYGNVNSVILATGLNFFISNGNLLYWFVSAIIIIYLVSPFYLILFNNKPKLVTLIALLLSIVLIVLDFYYHNGKFLIFFTRVPSFIVGVYIGFLSNNECKIRNYEIYLHMLILCIVLLGGWEYLKILKKVEYFYKYIIYIFMTPCIIISCSYVLEYFSGKAELLYKGMNYLGSISFEVYLTHEMLRNILNPILKKSMNYDNTYIIYAMILFLVSIVCADWIRKITQNISKLRTIFTLTFK